MATQANFTRRHDLFSDAGFADPAPFIQAAVQGAAECGLDADAGQAEPISNVLGKLGNWAQKNLPASLVPLAALSPEFIFSRGGDIAGALWLARQLKPDLSPIETAAFLFSCANQIYHSLGKTVEATALVRFLVSIDFDYGDIYKELGVAYGFFQNREPNPFVWKIRAFLAERQKGYAASGLSSDLRILELGCGIGNDAQGFLTFPSLRHYIGTDISETALRDHRSRSATLLQKRSEVIYDLRNEDFVGLLDSLRSNKESLGVNLIYSYSSLHYFNSTELAQIFTLAREILTPSHGIFAFAIKGEGSIWDGQGIPLYRPDVWINLDGQSRWFPSLSKLRSMIASLGYDMVSHTQHEHWSYSEVGEPDMFHYCICTPSR